MLRDKSQELPSSLTPQWLLNRGAGAAAAGTDGAAGHKQQASAIPAAAREGKWVPDRWGPTEKDEKETKWGHEPFDRPARWAAEADGDERGLGGGRMPRDTGRWKPGGEREWGGAAQERPSVFPPADRDRAVDRWDRTERVERVELPPARDSPAQRGRWRADDKPQEKWGRGDTPTWRALPGEGGAPGPFRPVGRGAGMGEREPDRYGERPERGLGGVGIPRDEGGFGASRLADDRLPGKGRGFGGYGRGRPAGGPGVPGAYAAERAEWGRDAEPALGRTQSGLIGEGRTSRGRHKPKAYTIEHLEDLLEVMTIKCGKEDKELPLPRGITLEALGEIWKGYVYEESSFDSYHATAARSSMDLPPARTSMEAPSAAAAAAAPARRSFEGAPAAAADAAAAAAGGGGGPAPAAAVPAQVAAAPPAVAAVPPAAVAAVQPPAAVAAQQQLLALLPPGMVIQALEHDQWFYKDPNGNQQGPFSRHDILDWTEQGFFPVDTLPICSALPGQESVWTTLHTMIHVWAQMAGAQIRLPEPPQVPEPPHVPLQPDMNLGVMGHDQSRTRVEQWLQQQPDQQQQQQPVQQQQQAHLGLPYGAPGGMPAHTAAPGPFGSTFLAPGSGPMGGPGGPGWDAGPASAGFPQQPLFPPPAQSFAPGGPVAGPTAAGPGPHMGQAGPGPLGHGFGPAAGQPQQQQPQQRTLFGTPLEPTPPAVPEPVVPAAVAPAAAAAAGAAPLTSTGSKMLDLLFKRGVHAQAQQQQQQQQAPAVQAPAAAAPEPPAAAAAARPAQDTGSWETVPTKATKQQERAAAQHQRQQQQEQQQWQQPQQRQPSAQLQQQEEESVSAPSGPVQVPLFPQQQKPEPPKVAPWAAAAPAAAPTHTKSLREIQEEEQAQAAAEEAARAEAAAAAAAAANAAAAPAAPGAPWGGARPGSASSGAPPGWGPPPAAAVAHPLAAGLGRAGSSGNNVAAAAAAQPTGPVGADDQPAQLKKAMLGEVLRARLGNVGRTDSNASGNSAGQAAAAAGPWGAVAAQRQAVPFTHIMQQETEETLADMEGGGAQEENLDDIIAALSRHNNSNNRQQQQQQQRQHSGAAANDDGLFWDYTGAAGSNAAPAAAPEPPVVQQPQQQQQTVWAQPPAAVAAMQAAAAASRATGAPSAAAPPPVAGPWARVSKHNVIKAPPPGSVPPPAAAPAARPPQPAAARAAPAARPAAVAAAAPAATAASRPAAAAGGGSNGAAAAVDGGLFMGGLDISAAFASWCRSQMLALNGNEDLTMIEFLWGLDSNSEIAEYCQMVWGNKPGVSSFVAEFVKRKLAEKNRKPGGKKKKGAAAAAAAAAVPQSSGVSAAAVGLVSAGPVSDLWSKIPKKPGGKKKKGTKMDPGALGFTTANNLSVLQEDDDE